MISLLLALLELLCGCHCSRWTLSHGAYRCAVVVQRCEFVDGFHMAAFGVNVCSRKCGLDTGASG